jgi:hypothetical protein
MSTDYERMMEAAEKLHGLTNPADVGRLIGQYDQMMTNWKSRGIPSKELLNVAKILGCDPFWLRDNEGEMVTIKLTKDDRHAVEINRSITNLAQRQAWYHVGNTLIEPGKPKDNGTQ